MCKIDNFSTAIILAGGKSSRMGFDKQFLKIKEKRVIDVVIDKLKEEFSEIIIVTNKPEEYKDSKHTVVSDIIKGQGPLSGLHVGLKYSKSKYAYFIACDMPNINIDYIRYMKQRLKQEKYKPMACVTTCEKFIEAFNAFYSKNLYEKIEESLKDDKRSVNSLLKRVDTLFIDEENTREFSPNWDMFINLNTQEELKNYTKNELDKK